MSLGVLLAASITGCGQGNAPQPPDSPSVAPVRGRLPAVAMGNWPSFRGVQASGISLGKGPPLRWNLENGRNIRWIRPIPGLGHSSPVVWGDRVFLTSAVSDSEPTLRVGLYGDITDLPEDRTHHFRVYCLDKGSGEILWERTARSGKPQVRRHIKASHASPTPATDGRHLVVSFGSEGLFCYDLDGTLLWQRDLGLLDAGPGIQGIQWGYASSPIIDEDQVIVVCDIVSQSSFLAAFDLESGEERWRTPRDERATWGTPTAHQADGRKQVLVNGYRHIGGYDAQTGEELWWLRGGGDAPIPTPIVAHGLVFITNAHGPLKPIYAIRLDARGDISLEEGTVSNQHVAWSHPRRGVYIPTPLVYGDYLYLLGNNGVLTCLRARTGHVTYHARVAGHRGAYTASPVAAGGKLYMTDEYGDVHVLQAGPEYQHLATNPMGEWCLATPAISGEMLFVRTHKHLVAIGEPEPGSPSTP
ncbi:MAG: PQQ-binding-like beta-propeller repeat protein [bacterium]|nr:PQQ-binding-like beta-propeller repeat protein [bacterium]